MKMIHEAEYHELQEAKAKFEAICDSVVDAEITGNHALCIELRCDSASARSQPALSTMVDAYAKAVADTRRVGA